MLIISLSRTRKLPAAAPSARRSSLRRPLSPSRSKPSALADALLEPPPFARARRLMKPFARRSSSAWLPRLQAQSSQLLQLRFHQGAVAGQARKSRLLKRLQILPPRSSNPLHQLRPPPSFLLLHKFLLSTRSPKLPQSSPTTRSNIINHPPPSPIASRLRLLHP